MNIMDINLDYEKPVKIADGIYWVGFYDKESGLHCNPYLIIEEKEAILIDGGSRPDFSTVMMKILDTGIEPSAIKRLIYHHYDPDLCGSIPSLEDIIENNALQIISQKQNNIFIKHYSVKSPLLCINDMNNFFEFKTGRKLIFIETPYAHSGGSFVTLDTKTDTLFSSDLFGSFSAKWGLFLNLNSKCYICSQYEECPDGKDYCPMPDIINFHKKIMTSQKALRYAIKQIFNHRIRLIAPQHGSIIYRIEDIEFLCVLLSNLKEVGIDAYL